LALDKACSSKIPEEEEPSLENGLSAGYDEDQALNPADCLENVP